ncbi:MAG: SiaB family protein kinase [Campylobacterales bacterium]|nr:SiaB family protein kinase [Campylobacterales bacterium]
MKFGALENILESDGIIFLTYGGFLTQALISGMTEALELEATKNDLSMKITGNLFTIFIELAQNMMNYAKAQSDQHTGNESKGLIVVGQEHADKNSYYIISRNLINADDKSKIEARLKSIEGMDKEQLRELYRKQRKSGAGKHDHGAGIGFIEIARRCDTLEHAFEPVGDHRFFLTIKTTIHKN